MRKLAEVKAPVARAKQRPAARARTLASKPRARGAAGAAASEAAHLATWLEA